MASLRPRTIRGQLIASLVLFELLVLAVFAAFLVREQQKELQQRVDHRLEYQGSQLAQQAGTAIAEGRTAALQGMVSSMLQLPSIRKVQITDLQGITIVGTDSAMNGTLILPRWNVIICAVWISRHCLRSKTISARLLFR